ncbi:hypothetical protein QUC31_003417 [Theobroma cacao]
MDAVSSILSRLPLKSLLRFKSVSKEWYSLINDLYFIKLHHRQSVETKVNIIIKEIRSDKFLSTNFDGINFNNPTTIDHSLKHLSGCDEGGIDVLLFGSCNGLVCLINSMTIVLWNISTRDYKIILNKSWKERDAWWKISNFYGFGYDTINDDYKIVKVVQEVDSLTDTLISEAKIYSLKTNTWRRGEEIPYYFCYPSVMGTFVCGALHWNAIKEKIWGYPRSIIAFDVETENYGLIELLDNMENQTYDVVVGALQGCLCAIATHFNDTINIWMMKDYGVKESWTMLYSFQGGIYSTPSLYGLRPLTYSRNGDQLLLDRNGLSLLWYDLKEKKVKDVDLPQWKNINAFFVEICGESLIKLGDPTEE